MSQFHGWKARLQQYMERAGDLRSMLALIREMDEFQRHLRDQTNEMHRRAYAQMEKKTTDIDGQVFERTTDLSRTWDADAVLTELIAQAPLAVHPDSGELTIDGAALAERMRAVFHFDYCRQEAMKKYGLDPDKYCEKKWGNKRVRPQRSRRGVPARS